MSKQIWIAIIAIIIVIAGVWYYQSSKQVLISDTPIKIGAVLSLTGNASEYGGSTERGMRVALDEINRQAQKFELVVEDDASASSGVVSAFQKIISADKLPVVVGFVTSGGAMAAASVANTSKVVMISSLAGSDTLKDAGDYVFRTRESGRIHSEEMARFLKNKIKKDSVALFYANAENGISYASTFKNEFERIGGKVIYEDKYMEKSGDYRSALSKLKAANPEVVYIAGQAADMGLIINQSHDLGIKVQWLSTPGAESPKLISIGKDAVEGVIFSTPAFDPDSTDSKIDKFVLNYKNKYGEEPNFAAANGYDVVMLVKEVIMKYGYDAEKIKEGLYKTQNFQGVGGAFSFDQFGEVSKPVLFKTVKNGQFIKLEE